MSGRTGCFSEQNFVVIEHRLEFNHDFDWDDVQILDEEKDS